MDALEIARWQFGITTVYHFMMVPLTIGLGLVVAVIQTMWHRTGKPEYLRMTKFWGKLFLINFIMGVATGIVQEFQFGMAWSEYSRFVGDVFGAPLAMEALLAFFVESTFLGLWIFGWKQLKPAVHLACLWIAVIGSVFSAYFIIVANSWMQHPVGVEMIDGRPVMTDAWAVFTNNTALVAVPHTIFGALAVAGALPAGHRLVPPVAPPPRRDRHDRRGRQGRPRRVRHPRPGPRRPRRLDPVPADRRRRRHDFLRRHRHHRGPAGQAHVRTAAHEDGGRRGGLPRRHRLLHPEHRQRRLQELR